ncbi:MAG: hypothetical protein QXU98_13240, partial [Candidatus Parvarchaeota archaeon]
SIAVRFTAFAGSLLPLLVSVFGGFAASLLIFLFSGSAKKKEFGSEIVRWASVWKKMPIERKEYIAYHYDILLSLSPGESMGILEGLFGRGDYTEIVKQLNKQSNRIDDIEKELKDVRDSIKDILEKHERKLEEHERKLEEHERKLGEQESKIYDFERELLSQIGYVRISGKIDETIMNFLVNNGIKVQLTMQIDKKEVPLPYVTPESENIQKMFKGEISACIAGLSGSGKSRLLYEVIKKRIADDKVNDIIVLNTNITEEQRKRIEITSGIKIEPGRIGPVRLKELDFPDNLNEGSERKTLVIWDNFGLGLTQTVAENFISALNQIDDGRNVRYALTLNKDVYSRGVESFDFKNVIDLSGITSTYEYVLDLLEKWFTSLLGKKYDNMEEVASLLYKRWGSPQSIYYFINYLIENPNSDPLEVAKEISNEEFKTYVERQFELLSPPKRSYLAAVKIANTIFNHPTFEKVNEMWERMKSGDLAEPLTTLSAFLYLSQGEIKMHDLYQELFKFSPDQLRAVFDYLKESSNNYESIYQMVSNVSNDYDSDGLGSLIGKYSCDYMSTEELEKILLPSSSVDMPGFFFSMGESFGKNFGSFNHAFQTEIIKLSYLVKDSNFAYGLSRGVGSIFDRLNENVQVGLIELARENEEFADGLGFGVGSIFDRLNENVQLELIEFARENEEFADGLGFGVGSIFDRLNENVQVGLIELAIKNERSGFWLGSLVGRIFDRLNENVQVGLIELAIKNERSGFWLGSGVGSIFDRLNENIQLELIEFARENEEFANGLSRGVGRIFDRLNENVQVGLIELARENERSGFWLGFGVGSIFDRLNENIQLELIEFARENERFADGLGFGVGSIFDRLNENIQLELIEFARENEEFANGLGFGVGSIFDRLNENVQVGLIELARENEEFANGLGRSVGRIFDRLNENVQLELIEFARENEKFANGLGFGVRFIFHRLKKDVQRKLKELVHKD